MHVPPECEGIEDQIADLQRDRDLAQDLLQEAPPAQRAGLLARIRALNAQVMAAQNRLADCVADNGPPPAPPLPPVEGVFDGTATITTTFGQARGPFAQAVRFGVMLNSGRTVIAMTSFPIVQTTFDTPLGRNTTTVRRIDGGSGSYAAGRMMVPLGLRFDHSINLPFLEEDSDLRVVLTTDPPGAPVTPEPFGSVTLVGGGRFDGGILGGDTGTLTLAGAISAAMPPGTTTVPDVRERRRDAAVAAVLAASLVPRTTGTDGPDAWVYRQTPAGGTTANRGSVVALLLRTGAIP